MDVQEDMGFRLLVEHANGGEQVHEIESYAQKGPAYFLQLSLGLI